MDGWVHPGADPTFFFFFFEHHQDLFMRTLSNSVL